jgi:hypothetical protein
VGKPTYNLNALTCKQAVSQENFYYAAKNTGFESNSKRTEGTFTKYVSIDDRLDPFHWITGYMKFGYGRTTREACTDIRCGHITREEGVVLDSKSETNAFF